jgi:hypothetical protein
MRPQACLEAGTTKKGAWKSQAPGSFYYEKETFQHCGIAGGSAGIWAGCVSFAGVGGVRCPYEGGDKMRQQWGMHVSLRRFEQQKLWSV